METEMKELKEQKVAEEYLSSLADLNVNSKPLINMLTILAEENIEHASVIVKVVEQHIAKVHPDIKLPILYLIDSIVKNVKSTYISLFSQCIVNIFCGVFEQVSEKIRERMYTLRQTWNEVFTAQKLYTLDVKVNCMDRNWPITAKVTKSPSIHVNPNFLKKNEMEATLRVKTRELLELEKRKLELELEATKKLLQEQEKQLSKQTESVKGGPELHTHIRHPTIGAVTNAMHHPAPRGMNPSFHNYRNTGPRQSPPNMMNMNMQQTYPPGMAPQHPHQQKPKVHPVNPLLLNTIRPRDPRLARQQQQQQQQQTPSTQEKTIPIATATDMKSKFNAANPSVSIPPTPAQSAVVSQSNNSVVQGSGSYRNSKSYESRSTKRRDTNDRSNHDRSSRDRSVHDRSSKSRSEEEHSDGGSGGRSKSSTTSNRSKRGESRTRSESKSPTRVRGPSARSSNQSGSSSREKERRGTSNKTNADRRKAGRSNSRSNDQKYSTACPKIDEEPEVSNDVTKKKSSSPTPSPPKYKDSKTKSSSTKVSRSYAGRKHKSRTPSPTLTKDVDLRVTHPDKRARLAPHLSNKVKDIAPNEEKMIMPPPPPSLDVVQPKTEIDDRVPPAANIKFELETLTTNVTAKSLDQNLEAIHSVRDVDLRQFQRITSIPHQTTTSTATPANVVQSINKLETSSEILAFSNGSSNNNSDVQIETKGEIKPESDCVDIRPEDICKEDAVSNGVPIGDKKRQSTEDPGEPVAKRSKTGKIDGLFGTEDVDLRTVIPTVIIHSNPGIMTPPPPPVISNEKENWAKVKGSSPATKISPNKSSLDDVRAKLAKTAKFNKMEKSHKELSQKFKIYELQDETTSQECNDNKIREMINQAQESLESRSINEEQYQYLVKTAMQINETNKLNAAKRLESLNSEEKSFEPSAEKPPMDPERLAREAVHKKRIPKLSKEQQQQSALNAEVSIDLRDSPILIDDNSQENTDIMQGTKQQGGEKEKRVKVSKWSAPSQAVNNHAGGAMMSSQQQSQRQRFGAGQNQGNRPQFNNRMLMPSPWQNPNNIFNGTTQPRPITAQASAPAPPPPQAPTLLIPKPCNSVDNPQVDVVRTITIDGRTKEIRFYGDVAIVFMDWDQPREIGFQPGTRTITIDNKETIVLNFNDAYKEVTIGGDPHKMRFAFPSRELYIDEHWYEVYFGGPAMPIPINSKIHLLQAEGPPPQVHIGILRRDLVVGKINMIVDARNIIPVFLDSDPQTFTLDGKQHVMEFADNLKTVIIDNEPMNVEYGGLPKSMILSGRKYFVRFGALPAGIVPGQHVIKGMKYLKLQPPTVDRVPTPPAALTSDIKSNPLPIESDCAVSSPPVSNPIASSSSVIPGIAPILPNVNIDELFQKLISTGILNTITNNNTTVDSKPVKEEDVKPSKDFEPIKPVKLHVPETIKTRQAAIINTLFCGMQCSSCGVRFPPEQTIKYSQHLDWHFRQNRRERDSSRKAHSRKWYYEVSDWLQYEEIEDLEDREKNFFESQQVDLENIDESSNQRTSNSPIPSCPAAPGDVDRACDMCQEKFEQFYNEDLEEWHLRAAIRVEDKIYHPLCHEDYKLSLIPPEPEPETEKKTDEHVTEITIEDDNAVDIAIVKTENIEDNKPVAATGTTDDDDDDDVIVVPTEEPSITEIDDDEEYVPINMSREEMGGVADDNVVAAALNETMESDVEIQEPNIPFTDLDTYVEKPSTMDEASQSSLLNVKIKEEPKDDDEEDDGFEDVGIVLIPEEEISIQSSDENTATRTISSTVSSPTPSPTVAEVTAETSQPPVLSTDTVTAAISLEAPEAANSMDGNLEPNDNPLSATTALVGVNKIKINMTKNIVTSNNSTSTTTITKSNSLNQNELKSSTTSGGSVSNISTIPVLCSGAMTISTMSSLAPVALGNSSGGNSTVFSGHSTFSTIPSLCNPVSSAANGSSSTATNPSSSNVIQVITSHTTTGPANMDAFPNSIPVIGSNSKSGSSNALTSITTRESATPPLPSTVSKSPKSSVVEDEEPTFTFKQELQNVQLKKVKKIECGLEASGLCSIM